MVTQGILDLIFSVVNELFSWLPDFSWSVESGMYTTFMECVSGVLYFLPLDTILAILSIICTIQVFRIIVAFLRMLWSVLPLV